MDVIVVVDVVEIFNGRLAPSFVHVHDQVQAHELRDYSVARYSLTNLVVRAYRVSA